MVCLASEMWIAYLSTEIFNCRKFCFKPLRRSNKWISITWLAVIEPWMPSTFMQHWRTPLSREQTTRTKSMNRTSITRYVWCCKWHRSWTHVFKTRPHLRPWYFGTLSTICQNSPQMSHKLIFIRRDICLTSLAMLMDTERMTKVYFYDIRYDQTGQVQVWVVLEVIPFSAHSENPFLASILWFLSVWNVRWSIQRWFSEATVKQQVIDILCCLY